jgi:phage tail-like protein
MLSDLQAESDIRGARVDLSWCWLGSGSRPGFRLVRRRRAYPGRVDEGVSIVDLDDLFGATSSPAVRVERSFYLPRNTEVESRLQMAEVALHFAATEAAQPYRAFIGYYDRNLAEYRGVDIAEVNRITRAAASAPPWAHVRTLEVFVTPGGGPEASAGRIEVSTDHEDGLTPNRFAWIPAAGSATTVPFDRIEEQGVTVRLDESLDPDSSDWKRRVIVEDRGLEPEQIYYYRIFMPAVTGPEPFHSERDWRTAVMATGRYGLSEQLYRRLPGVHQYYDEPVPAERGRGQLRRFLGIHGAALDQARSQAEGLRSRHDLHEAHADVLPSLARWIGWQPDLTLDAPLLRNDIVQAPEIYRTMGTVPNLRAMVNRVTGWDCEIKEFVHNLFLTNAPETIRLWEIWHRTHDGTSWSQPAAMTRTEGFDGQPSLVEQAGAPWLVWHADRDGGRDLWLMRRDGAVGPYRAVLHGDGEIWPRPVNEYPAAINDGTRLWLFWDSNRDDSWNIWGASGTAGRPFEGVPEQPATNLTAHPADDRHPAAVRDALGRLWLFWESNRRGPTDIWARVHDPVVGWGDPQRVSTAHFRHERPAAVVDGDGRLWLFYSDDLGDRRNLVVTVHGGDAWSEPVVVTDGTWRDEAPTAALRGGQVWLFWQSDRGGQWQILGQAWDWDGAQGRPAAAAAPFPLTTEATADKEPSAFVDSGGDLHVVWRTQRRGQDYRSRTVDTGDAEMLALLGGLEDRAHYTYDTAATDNDWYARDTIGIFLTPFTEQPDVVDRNRRLLEGPLREFLPIHVRPVLFIKPAVHKEHVYTYDFPEIEPQRTIGEDFARETTAFNAETYTGLDDGYIDTMATWIWLRSWSSDHTGHRTVDTTASPIDTSFRAWHIGVQTGG